MKDLTAFLRHRLRVTQTRAIKDDRRCSIRLDDLLTLWDKQAGLCAYSGRPMTYTREGKRRYQRNKTNVSIDRVDSGLGYTRDNIVLCCGVVNMMKTDMTKEEFISWITDVSHCTVAK